MHAIWNLFFTVFFVWLLTMSFFWLSDQGLLIADIPAFHLVLLSIATFRLVRLFTYDHIMEPIRSWLSGFQERTFLGTGAALLKCPWCTGMWFAFLAYVGYAAIPNVVLPVALILSIAGVASLFQLLANLIGWSAEEKKQRVERM